MPLEWISLLGTEIFRMKNKNHSRDKTLFRNTLALVLNISC